jgi:hypothetical protein
LRCVLYQKFAAYFGSHSGEIVSSTRFTTRIAGRDPESRGVDSRKFVGMTPKTL